MRATIRAFARVTRFTRQSVRTLCTAHTGKSLHGLVYSTTSNDALAAFEQGLNDFLGWKGNPVEWAKRSLEADPNFVMGKVLLAGMDAMGSASPLGGTEETWTALSSILRQEKEGTLSITPREALHVKAVTSWIEHNDFADAVNTWEHILLEHPTDTLALRFAYDAYFYMGYSRQIRDSITRVLPQYSKAHPYYGYILGMHAFGLEEMGEYARAEETALQALEINKLYAAHHLVVVYLHLRLCTSDAWAAHARVHVLEMTGRSQEGVSFLDRSHSEWTQSTVLACHLYWHKGLFMLDLGELDQVLALYAREIGHRALASHAPLDLVDAASLLARLEFAGYAHGLAQYRNMHLEKHWDQLAAACEPRIDDHRLVFNDLHYVMAALGANRADLFARMKNSLNLYAKENAHKRVGSGSPLSANEDYNAAVLNEIGDKLLYAVTDYFTGDFDGVIGKLSPVTTRNKIWRIGGSHAQRDLLEQLLLVAALKARHKPLARALVNERKAVKPSSRLTARFAEIFQRFPDSAGM